MWRWGGGLEDGQLRPRDSEGLAFVPASLKRVTCPRIVWVEGTRGGEGLSGPIKTLYSATWLPPLSQCPEAQSHVLPAVPGEGAFQAVSCLSELRTGRPRESAVAAEDGADPEEGPGPGQRAVGKATEPFTPAAPLCNTRPVPHPHARGNLKATNETGPERPQVKRAPFGAEEKCPFLLTGPGLLEVFFI